MRLAIATTTLLSLTLSAQRPAAAGFVRQEDGRDLDERIGAERLARIQAAVPRGLTWLAERQLEYGAWAGDVGVKRGDSYIIQETDAQQRARGAGHMGVSALAGLAFLAAGHLPDRGPFGKTVRKSVDYVLAHVQENGFVTDSGTNMYSHAFATLFLAQVHGMAREKRIRDGLERAVHLIVDCQNSQGAWRYYAFSPEADLSVTVCQLQALRAAYNIGIQVPRAVMDRAVDYVRRSQVTRGYDQGLFAYKIRGRGAWDRTRDYAINAAAVTSLFSAGVYEEKLYGKALEFVADDYPAMHAEWHHHYYYWYGSYYALQAMHHVGGARYDRFAQRLWDDLLALQQTDGRWVDRVGPGDEFSTAIACLLLALPWQMLPIFQR